MTSVLIYTSGTNHVAFGAFRYNLKFIASSYFGTLFFTDDLKFKKHHSEYYLYRFIKYSTLSQRRGIWFDA